MDHIRVLGCKAYVYIQKQRRVQSQKFGPRAEEGYLVGFEGNHIYRIWIPKRNKVVRSSTVTFDKNDDSHLDLYEPESANVTTTETIDDNLD